MCWQTLRVLLVLFTLPSRSLPSVINSSTVCKSRASRWVTCCAPLQVGATWSGTLFQATDAAGMLITSRQSARLLSSGWFCNKSFL